MFMQPPHYHQEGIPLLSEICSLGKTTAMILVYQVNKTVRHSFAVGQAPFLCFVVSPSVPSALKYKWFILVSNCSLLPNQSPSFWSIWHVYSCIQHTNHTVCSGQCDKALRTTHNYDFSPRVLQELREKVVFKTCYNFVWQIRWWQ